MIFDKLVSIVENQMHEIKYIVEDAKIFEFPFIAHEVLKQDPEKYEEMADTFYLPFSITAIEDKASCVVLIDTEENQRGLWGRRNFIECMSLDADDKAFNKEMDNRVIAKSGSWMELHRTGHVILSMGYIEKGEWVGGTDVQGIGNVDKCCIISKNNIVTSDLEKDMLTRNENAEFVKEDINKALINVWSAMEEIHYFNTPDRFILEISPTKRRKNNKKIPRSHERPFYTILKPFEIREKMGLPQIKSHNSPIPHERRRHERFLSNVRYSIDSKGNKRVAKIIPYGPRKGEHYFKRVDVPAVWVGPTEKVKGNKFYKVLINKEAKNDI